MKTMMPLIAVLLATTAAGSPASADTPPQRPWMDSALSADQRADALAAAMTQDEKLTLVFGYFGSFFVEKNFTPPAEALMGSAGYVPGVPRLGIPAQFVTDAGVGVATQGSAPVKRGRTALPSGIATAATWNPELAHAAGAMIGDEAHRSGFNVMLAGGVNLMRDPRNGRNFEYGGEDPLLAGTIVGAQIAGIQSNNVISTIKHYALNDQETARATGNSVIDPAAARMSDLLAFEIAMEKGDPGSVMCAYNHVNGVYSCENPWLLTDVLRRDWGFKGYVMSDWGGVHSTVQAVKAGLDQQSGWPFDKEPYLGAGLKQAIANGEVSDAELTLMARRVAYAMFRHGLFENPPVQSTIDLAAHAEVTRKGAEEAAVLLKNAGAILPLSPTVRSIAIIGGHADKGVLAGSGSSLVYPVEGNAVPGLDPIKWPGPVMYYPSSPLEEIRRQAPNAKIRFVDGADPQAAAQVARDSDVAIVFGTQWSGEDFDVKYALDGSQDALIAAVAAANAKTVVVLETNASVAMPWIDRVGAAMMAWYPGTQGGAAIANLLFGKVNPSGRLPVTVARSTDQLPNPAAPAAGDVKYSEGAAVGYKWFDAKGIKPLFPFGFGLSYTQFGYGELSATPKDAGIAVRFTVRNTGKRAGAAVPQVYVGGNGWEAPKRLGGFSKVMLEPGKSQAVSLTIDPRLLATFDTASNSWKIAPGSYQVMLASSSRDIAQTVTVRLDGATLPAARRP